MSRTRSWARPRAVVALAATFALSTAMFATASTAHATPESQLAAERDKATQLEAQIEANGNRVSILDEQYNRAQLAIQQADEQIAAAQSALDARRQESDAVRAELATRGRRAVHGRRQPARRSPHSTSVTRPSSARVRRTPARRPTRTGSCSTGRRSRSSSSACNSRRWNGRRPMPSSRATALDAARKEIEQATADQQQLLAQSQGRIATLVDEVRAEREAAAEAAARAAMERAAEARAAQAAETTTVPQPTSTDGGTSSGSTDPTAGSPGPVPAPNGSAQVAVDTARAQLGKPYVYAGSGPDVFDCSGLTMYAWAAAGVSLPHNAEAQYMSLPHVSQSELQPGDLVFFGAPIHHVGIYVGGGTMIEAPYTGVDVRYHTIYRSDYAGAARP